ncbi:MAG: photosystem II stability/assembly factor-like uncharacterized protein [Myxococcota bacterium]|jgi:photosystem II stability/assembly factor-like uncharacterized protein
MASSSCSLSILENKNFVAINDNKEGFGSMRGLAVNGEMVASSGENGVLTISGNGGKSFNGTVRLNPDLDYRDVEVLNDQTIVVMSAGPGAASTITRVTTVGNENTVHPALVNEHEQGFWDGIAFLDGSNYGLLVGDAIDGKLTVMITNDGAASYRAASNPPQVGDRQYCFAASGTSLALVSQNLALIATGGEESQVWRSTDGGDNWTAIDIPFISGSDGSGVFSIAFKDDAHGVIVGGDYERPEINENVAAFTNDGGLTWTASTVMTGGYRSAVDWLDEYGAWFAVGPDGCDWSYDGVEWFAGPAEFKGHTMVEGWSSFVGSKLLKLQ